jgi:hypothetical protein
LTAFPIAMLIGAAVAEALRMMGGAAWLEGAARFGVIVGAVTAAVAAALGWAFAMERSDSWVLEAHRWLGTGAAGFSVVLLALSEMKWRRAGRWRLAFRAALFIGVPLIIVTGYFGGAMVYGMHAYSWRGR